MCIPSPEQAQPRKQRRWSTADKALIVRRHLRDKISVADLSEETGAAPSQIHSWIKRLLERAELTFADQRGKAEQKNERLIAAKDERIQHLQEVTAELSMEILQLKKAGA